MAHFRVEFMLDQATGKYRAEMYHPERQDELLVRTDAVYPSQEAAVLGLVQLFKEAIQKPAPARVSAKAKAKKNRAKPKPARGKKKARRR